MDVDLDQARRRAKELLRAARAGDRQARAALRPDRLPRLTDARHAVARELASPRGPRSPATSKRAGGPSIEEPTRPSQTSPPRTVRPATLRGRRKRVLEPGPAYVSGRPVRVRLRIRGRRQDLDDFRAAVRAAGTPDGWFEIAERLVAAAGLNVNRRGVVFLPTVAGRDVEALARKVADTSLALYQELLERQS
jgi:hypothetical protein